MTTTEEQQDSIDLVYNDILTSFDSLLAQRTAVHLAIQRGSLALTREKTQTRRRFEYALVAPHRVRRTKAVAMATGAGDVEFQLVGRGVVDDDDDDEDDEESVAPLVAFGGALPSQAVRDAQAQFEDALTRAIQLANETVRFNALLRQLNTLEETKK
jgi:hypothetical protein